VIVSPVLRAAASAAVAPTVVVAVVLGTVVARVVEGAAAGERRPSRVGIETVAVEVLEHDRALGVMIVTIVADVTGGVAHVTAIEGFQNRQALSSLSIDALTRYCAAGDRTITSRRVKAPLPPFRAGSGEPPSAYTCSISLVNRGAMGVTDPESARSQDCVVAAVIRFAGAASKSKSAKAASPAREPTPGGVP
jgi:hypothetical protein